MWFTGLWFAIDWFLRLLCLQNQQKERFLYITASGGDSKLDFFYKHFLLFPRNHEMENSYNFLILLPHVLCAREWEKKKDRSSIMSYIKEKLVSDISLARQWPHEKKMLAALCSNLLSQFTSCSYILRRPQNFSKSPSYLLFYVVPVKSKVEISQNFVAFSEYMNFMQGICSKIPFLFWNYAKSLTLILFLVITFNVINHANCNHVNILIL